MAGGAFPVGLTLGQEGGGGVKETETEAGWQQPQAGPSGLRTKNPLGLNLEEGSHEAGRRIQG